MIEIGLLNLANGLQTWNVLSNHPIIAICLFLLGICLKILFMNVCHIAGEMLKPISIRRY